MARAKKPTGAELGALALAKAVDTAVGPTVDPQATADDKDLLSRFAIAMLAPNTGQFDVDNPALRQRCKDALARARVMLEEFKNFNL